MTEICLTQRRSDATRCRVASIFPVPLRRCVRKISSPKLALTFLCDGPSLALYPFEKSPSK
jgi:hypothetical protein